MRTLEAIVDRQSDSGSIGIEQQQSHSRVRPAVTLLLRDETAAVASSNPFAQDPRETAVLARHPFCGFRRFV